MPDRIAALVSFLQADSDMLELCAGRVYRNRVPDAQISRMPRGLVLLRPAGLGLGFGGGYQQFGAERVDALCYGYGEESAYALYEVLRGKLKQMQRTTINSVVLHLCTQSAGPIASDDPGLAFPYGTQVDPSIRWPMVLSSWQVVAAEIPAAA